MKSKYIGNPITKDLLNRKLSGVCAGLGQHYNIPANAVRLLTIVFGCLFPVLTVMSYLLATWLMPDRKF